MSTPNAFPDLTFVIELPEMLDPLHAHARVNRFHDQAVKEAGRKTLIRHQTQRLPGHFQVPARSKYRHYPRSPRVQQRKQRLNQPDLVRKGTTRAKMTRSRPHALRAGGTAGSGRVTFTMVLRFPEHFRERAGAQTGVTRAKMAEELARWTQNEESAAAAEFRDFYVQELKKRMSSRVRKRISGRLAELGIQ